MRASRPQSRGHPARAGHRNRARRPRTITKLRAEARGSSGSSDSSGRARPARRTPRQAGARPHQVACPVGRAPRRACSRTDRSHPTQPPPAPQSYHLSILIETTRTSPPTVMRTSGGGPPAPAHPTVQTSPPNPTPPLCQPQFFTALSLTSHKNVVASPHPTTCTSVRKWVRRLKPPCVLPARHFVFTTESEQRPNRLCSRVAAS
jgi:hypothetical protein